MNYIYHEKQEGSLCGQHCLNNLLQGQYFSAVELAEIAQQMDQEEKRHMAELGTHTADFRQFLEQPSSNMDDSGMFSVQVLTSALNIWSLSLVPYASSNQLAVAARSNPVDQTAYICNFKEHWFTVRKLGRQWFNLNSLLTFPELISDTYLSLFLKQLQHEGYSIFVLEGQLPHCEANDALALYPAEQTVKPQLLSEVRYKEDQELKSALQASLNKVNLGYGGESSSSHVGAVYSELLESEDEELKSAVRMSLEDATPTYESQPLDDDLQRAISLSLSASEDCSTVKKHRISDASDSSDMERALQMSLDSTLCEVRVPENLLEPDLEEIRRKRLDKLDKK